MIIIVFLCESCYIILFICVLAAIPSVNLRNSEEITISPKKLGSSSSENKENETSTPTVKTSNGYIISYLGKNPSSASDICF